MALLCFPWSQRITCGSQRALSLDRLSTGLQVRRCSAETVCSALPWGKTG